MNLNKVRTYAEEFMKREYPDEAPYFHIAWEIFEEVLQENEDELPDLKGPIVRFEGEDTIAAPQVIRAFHTIFSKLEKEIESSTGDLRSLVRDLLIENKFSSEFSSKIADFFLKQEHWRDQAWE